MLLLKGRWNLQNDRLCSQYIRRPTVSCHSYCGSHHTREVLDEPLQGKSLDDQIEEQDLISVISFDERSQLRLDIFDGMKCMPSYNPLVVHLLVVYSILSRIPSDAHSQYLAGQLRRKYLDMNSVFLREFVIIRSFHTTCQISICSISTSSGTFASQSRSGTQLHVLFN